MYFSKKLISLIMCTVMFLNVSFLAFAADAVTDAAAKCVYDAYSETTHSNVRVFNDSQALYCGTVYDRYATLKFDITPFYGVDFGGAVLTINVRNSYDATTLSFYGSYDGSLETAEFVTAYVPTAKGKFRVQVTITEYVRKAIDGGAKELTFFVRSNAPSTTIFSSESGDKSVRPSLMVCEDAPYVKEQMPFVYPDVSADTFKADLQKSISKGHPYIFGHEEDFERVRQNAFGQNAYLTKMYNTVKEGAAKYVGKAPANVDEVINNDTYNTRALECLRAIMWCAFVYKVEGLQQYAERAWEEVETWANLSSWGTNQYIDNNHPVLGLAICYDWLYDWLGAEKREKIITSLKTKHFDTIYDMYKNPNDSKYSRALFQHYFGSANHGLLDNTATFVAAMAIADTDMERMTFVMQEGFKLLEPVVKKWYPDSGWYEGIGYWQYTGVFMARWLLGMQSALGTTYGLTDLECMKGMANYPVYGSSSKYAFVVNDTFYEQTRPMTSTYALSTLSGDAAYEKYTLLNDTAANPENCLAFRTDVDYDEVELTDLKYDKIFRNTDMLTMRSTWSGNQELFCGLYVQDANRSHGVMNSGTIVLEAFGEQWITNPGRDNYNLDGYWDNTQNGKRWQYYFSRPEANSCLVINPGTEGGQIINPGDSIGTYVFEDRGAYAVSDLTKTYGDYAESYRRGVMLADDRTKFIVQDEVKLTEAQEVYSFVNLNKCDDIVVSEDQKSVILSKGNKKVMVRIACDTDYELSIMKATPLPTSPQMADNKVHRDLRRLAVHFPETEGFSLRIEFIPYLIEEELVQASEDITPIDEWSIPDGELDIMGVQSITLDGAALEGFNSANRCYKVDALPEKIEYTADESRYEISTRTNDDNSAKYLILKDKSTGRYFSYMFELPVLPKDVKIIDVTGYNDLKIADVFASTDDGNVPQNTIDGDATTRWSASGIQTITWELSSSAKLHCIALAYHSGDKRSSYFDLEVSADGNTWKTISADNESSGRTLDFEYYDLKDEAAKFVRLTGYGNSASAWNSITEAKIWGK